MHNNKLKLNDDKTEYMVLCRPNNREKVEIHTVNVGCAKVSESNCVRNLGVLFDNNLSMQSYVNNICKSSFYYLRKIRQIRKCLTTKATESLIHAFISSRIDYCNSLLYGIPMKILQKLQ